jgi:hypothetical protein
MTQLASVLFCEQRLRMRTHRGNGGTLTDETTERLDRIIGILEIAFVSELDAARLAAHADPVARAVLTNAEKWIGSGALKASVVAAALVSEKTAQRKILELVDRAALTSRGPNNAVEYRSTGLL